jgi:hypothetical protein
VENKKRTEMISLIFPQPEAVWGSSRVFPFGQTMDHGHFGSPHWANNALPLPNLSGYRPSWVTAAWDEPRNAQKCAEIQETPVTTVTCG